MAISFFRQLPSVAQKVATANDASAPQILADALGQIVAPDFSVSTAQIADADGLTSPQFTAVVYRVTQQSDRPPVVLADDAAAAIDLIEHLSVDTLRVSYARIALAKKLKKAKVPNGEDRTNITLGIVYARRSSISLEAAAEELYRLNSETSYSFWPDMIVVDSIGVINYAVQFPGEGVSGDFLPPAEGAFKRGAPPIYIVVVMRPMAAHSFAKMVAFLIPHLQLFAPDAGATRQLNWGEVLDNLSKQAVTVLGFQPNLKGEIVPVPRDEYADRFMPQVPVVIEDAAGNVMSTVTNQFISIFTFVV